jgi:hypothetical protein
MVIDIFMPRMRGFESIRTFHERAPLVPLNVSRSPRRVDHSCGLVVKALYEAGSNR